MLMKFSIPIKLHEICFMKVLAAGLLIEVVKTITSA